MDRDQTEHLDIERRTMLKGAGALGLGALASSAALAGIGEAFAADDHSMHHGHATGAKNAKMIEALHNCMRTGDDCIHHCLIEFKAGDTAMADCARIVLETGAFCAAHAKLVTMDSAYMKELCELSIKMCGACEKECRKHEKKHSTCKACADACADCIKECKSYLKA
ncbi:twin-arginine translocation signal/Cys-rich four helix bundle protein [Mariprofundus ferrinatatus]|uniref:Twin-arginine translocation signal/Cys-rich four helix bundle protein n=1 Tax=Mariprofundus ferrinatatus TaxID=1921087 RepID=A0A2K8L5H7_9PROT|nr:Csp1 family four helix bundle copper storage protein [Mariprofundus ferrinatatus]ATX82362.1 twin-arginine translocation signal/Cys-rich four helix bundle protein [Mariprofundus ferrinatatus]